MMIARECSETSARTQYSQVSSFHRLQHPPVAKQGLRCRQRCCGPVQCSVATAEPIISIKAEQGLAKRRLIMMRHADSEERLQSARDHDRPITEAGKMCAREVAQKLAERGWLPDLIMSSDSSRTRQTLSTMAEAVATFGTADTHFRGSLYTVAALDGQLRSHLQGLVTAEVQKKSREVSCVLCVGHNKGMEEAASSLAGETIRLETANAALLERAAASWEEALCEEACWTLVELLKPDTLVEG
ncbi:Uncharacterized protein At3g52155, chloroplastic [Coccomyxa sp. Obi]|nr:Uncharacterized protein At3g52155, chloroplastic [Coccomyxa sp. Obi]